MTPKTSELGLKPAHSIFIKANQDEWGGGGGGSDASAAAADLVAAVQVTNWSGKLLISDQLPEWFQLKAGLLCSAADWVSWFKCDAPLLYITAHNPFSNPVSLLSTAQKTNDFSAFMFYSPVKERKKMKVRVFLLLLLILWYLLFWQLINYFPNDLLNLK